MLHNSSFDLTFFFVFPALFQDRRKEDLAQHPQENWLHPNGANQQDWEVLWAQV